MPVEGAMTQMPPLLVNALYGSRQVLAAAKVLSLPWDLVLKPDELDLLAHLPLAWNTRLKRRLGQFKFKRLGPEMIPVRIELNFNLLRGSKEGVIDTLSHETAHAVWPNDGHGPRWAMCCMALGGTGERCGKLEVPVPPKVVARCIFCLQPFYGYRTKKRALRCKNTVQCQENQRKQDRWGIVKA